MIRHQNQSWPTKKRASLLNVTTKSWSPRRSYKLYRKASLTDKSQQDLHTKWEFLQNMAQMLQFLEGKVLFRQECDSSSSSCCCYYYQCSRQISDRKPDCKEIEKTSKRWRWVVWTSWWWLDTFCFWCRYSVLWALSQETRDFICFWKQEKMSSRLDRKTLIKITGLITIVISPLRRPLRRRRHKVLMCQNQGLYIVHVHSLLLYMSSCLALEIPRWVRNEREFVGRHFRVQRMHHHHHHHHHHHDPWKIKTSCITESRDLRALQGIMPHVESWQQHHFISIILFIIHPCLGKVSLSGDRWPASFVKCKQLDKVLLRVVFFSCWFVFVALKCKLSIKDYYSMQDKKSDHFFAFFLPRNESTLSIIILVTLMLLINSKTQTLIIMRHHLLVFKTCLQHTTST